MSKGVWHPAAIRTAATVVGMSWMEAVLHTTSMHRLSPATPGVRRLIRRAASNPRGVAALPSPRRLAETLAAMVSMVPRSLAKSGNSRRRTGWRSLASFSASPARCITSITPIHRQRTPAMEIPSWMASPAPSRAAAASWPWLPRARAQNRDRAVIPVQITVIAMAMPPPAPHAGAVLSPTYVHRAGIMSPSPAPFFPENDNFRLTSQVSLL